MPQLAPSAAPLPFPFPPDIEPKMFLDSESIEEWKIQRKIDENTRIDLRDTLHSMYYLERQKRWIQGRNMHRDSLFGQVDAHVWASISCDERHIAASH